MDHVSELTRRERELRARVTGTLSGDNGVSADDREWIATQLADMRVLFDRHLAAVPPEERQYEEYRLEFSLPLWSYLSRTYRLFCADETEAARGERP